MLEILQLLGVAVPWKGKYPAPFPAVWPNFSARKQQTLLSSYTSGNLPKERVLKTEKSGMGYTAVLEAGRLRQRNDMNFRAAWATI